MQEDVLLDSEQGVIMDASEAMSIVQLPIIQEKFELLRQQIQTEIDQALSLECTEETVKDVKKARAALNSKFQQNYESARKEIKQKVLAPYNLFEDLYKNNVANQFKEADAKLAEKINQIEGVLKEKKKEEAIDYFNEYKASIGLSNEDFTWDDIGIGVTLSSSLKSLKEAAKKFLDNVQTDLVCIQTHQYSDEIMVEYRRNHSLSKSICMVEERHEAIEKERERAEALKREQEIVQEHEAEIREVLEEVEADNSQDLLSVPSVEKEEQEEEDRYNVGFEVLNATLDEIKRLINYLDDNGLYWQQFQL